MLRFRFYSPLFVAIFLTQPANAQTEERYLDCYAEILAADVAIESIRDEGAEIPYSKQKAMNELSVRFTQLIFLSEIDPKKIANTIQSLVINKKLTAIMNVKDSKGTNSAIALIDQRVAECEKDFSDELRQ